MEEIGMDPIAANPGPFDPSVLYDQDKHVSSAVWEGQVLFLIHTNLLICNVFLGQINVYSSFVHLKD